MKLKKILASILALCMVLSTIGTVAFAADGGIAEVNSTGYATLQAAVDAAESGDTVTVIADVADEAVTVNKNITITGNATLTNVSINAVKGCDSLEVSTLKFEGNSWINSGAAGSLKVSEVSANVAPVNTTYTNSRSAFISLGSSESQSLDLTVDGCSIVVSGGGNPVLGWAAVGTVNVTNNTFGSKDAYQEGSDSVKFMSIADGAIITMTGNTVYSNYNGFVFGQNCTRDNAYTVIVDDNTFWGTADHIWVEVSGATTTHATVLATSDNIVNGEAFTVADIKSSKRITEWTSYAGVDVVLDENGKIVSGQFTEKSNVEANLAPGFVFDRDSNEVVTAKASIDGVGYLTLADALAAAEKDDVITLVGNISDETVTINKNITIKAAEDASAMSLMSENSDKDVTLTNVIFVVENGVEFALDDVAVRGLSYIYAKTPDSISVTNCDIDVTTVEVSGTNCPPGFVLFSSNNGGSVEFTFTNNTLLAAPDATEDLYTYSHGIAGWNTIEKATITGNKFGSAEAPFGAAAVKLMNFTEGATVEASGNTFYVNSKDSTWGPNAFQLYQNNSRGNNYTATINDNDFYVDDATAAIGINTNAMGKPVDYAGGGHVAIGKDNTVNGQTISMSDVLVFGNGINDLAYTRGYVGVGVEFDANGKIIGGEFSEYSLGLADAIADGYATETDVAGNLNVVEETLLVDEIKVKFAPASEAEGEKVYNINLTAGGDVINRLNSADLTFLFEQIEGNNEYEIIASNSEVAINPVDNSKVRYEFHYNGKTDVETDTNATITIGQVKFTGYGKFSFAVDASEDANKTNAAHATKLFDNIVDTFVPDGELADGTVVGTLDVSDNTITDVEITVPVRTLTINLDFPNAVVDNAIAYQDMKVEITGTIDGVNQTVTYNLGTDEVAMANGSYIVTEDRLVLNNAYTVTVSGAGYRTARYTVTMTTDKTLRFWNNVMDENQVVELGKDSSIAKVTFLAGDIVKDNNINIYDLSAVVSYFGQTNDTTAYSNYAKYDLNRDGVIDSKDVAYVLVSWNN